MQLGISYRGLAITLTAIHLERSETGYIVQTNEYEGISTNIAQFALNLPLGNKAVIRNAGPISYLTVTLGLSATDAKWETDIENVEQDILFAPAFAGLSAAGRAAFKTWTNLPLLSAGAIPPVDQTPDNALAPGDADLLTMLQFEHLRGVETVPANTIILKLTGTLPTTDYPVVNVGPSIATTVFTSAQMVQTLGIPDAVAANMPGAAANSPAVPAIQPPHTFWGWRSRQANATFIGRGMVEVSYDWVFAAWSSYIFTLQA